jgi:hypothetical protein
VSVTQEQISKEIAVACELVKKERDRLSNELTEIKADMINWREEARIMSKELGRVRSVLITCEDRHHPDSEWCDEAKEVLG